MSCKKINRKILKHLKEDRKTWLKLSKEARQEARSDGILIKKIKKVV